MIGWRIIRSCHWLDVRTEAAQCLLIGWRILSWGLISDWTSTEAAHLIGRRIMRACLWLEVRTEAVHWLADKQSEEIFDWIYALIQFGLWWWVPVDDRLVLNRLQKTRPGLLTVFWIRTRIKEGLLDPHVGSGSKKKKKNWNKTGAGPVPVPVPEEKIELEAQKNSNFLVLFFGICQSFFNRFFKILLLILPPSIRDSNRAQRRTETRHKELRVTN